MLVLLVVVAIINEDVSVVTTIMWVGIAMVAHLELKQIEDDFEYYENDH